MNTVLRATLITSPERDPETSAGQGRKTGGRITVAAGQGRPDGAGSPTPGGAFAGQRDGLVTGSDLSGVIQKLITEKLLVEVNSEDADLLANGVLDSVTLIQLILHLEQSFAIRIDLGELDIDDLRSVRSISTLITRLRTVGLDGKRLLAPITAKT